MSDPERVTTGSEPRRWVVEDVASLPAATRAELALGSLPDDQGCRACKALGPHTSAPVYDTAANRLQHWHEELCRHVAGKGWEQDATRAGTIYGVAAALSEVVESGHDAREPYLTEGEEALSRAVDRHLEPGHDEQTEPNDPDLLRRAARVLNDNYLAGSQGARWGQLEESEQEYWITAVQAVLAAALDSDAKGYEWTPDPRTVAAVVEALRKKEPQANGWGRMMADFIAAQFSPSQEPGGTDGH